MRAEWIGQRAASLLARPACSGEVLAVVSGVVYLSLSGPAQEVLWLAPEGASLHRRCITASFKPEAVEPGRRFTSHDGYLRIGSALTVALGQAALWEPVVAPRSQCRPLAVVKAQFRKSLGLARCLPARGLGRLLESTIYSDTDDLGRARGAPSHDAFWLDRALPALQEVARACRAREMALVLQAGLKLVGFGPGLTPSGDDFLGGLLFTAHHLQAAYPREFRWDGELIPVFLDRARPRTNRLSYTILADLADGHGPEPLHGLVGSLLQGGTMEQLLNGMQRLTRIGHSSGWDMLAGVMTALLLVREKV